MAILNNMNEEVNKELYLFLSYNAKKWCGINLLNKVWRNRK